MSNCDFVPPVILNPSGIYRDLQAEIFKNNRIMSKCISSPVVTDLSWPVNSTDAANKAYVDAAAGSTPGGITTSVQFNDGGGIFGGDSDLTWNETANILLVNNGSVTGLLTPFSPTDAANKAYVDAASAPGGSDTEIQFNNSGSFDGSSNLSWNDGTNTLTVTGTVGATTVNATNVVGTTLSGTTVTGTTVTDGTASMSGGTITDGTASLTAGTYTGLVSVTSGTFTDGTATLNSGTLTGLIAPTAASDAANKAYVDAAIGSSPGLPLNSVQFNGAGVFSGDSDLTWTPGATGVLDVIGTVDVAGTITDGTASLLAGNFTGVQAIDAAGLITFTNATNSTTTSNGALVVTGGVGIGDDVNIGGSCGADEFFATSDVKLKENITPLTNSLDKISEIECYSYNMINSGHKTYGVLAQQLEKIGMEHLVKNFRDHKSVNYIQFIALLIDGMKELAEDVKKLKEFKMNHMRETLANKLKETKEVSGLQLHVPKPSKVKRSFSNGLVSTSVKNSKNTSVKETDRKNFNGVCYKFCITCGGWIPVEDFATNSKNKDSLKKSCKRH